MEVGLDTASGCEYNFTNLFIEGVSTVYYDVWEMAAERDQ